jgi:hypothetical protein
MMKTVLRALLLLAAAALVPACLPPKPPMNAFGKAYGGNGGERAPWSPVQDRDGGFYLGGTTYFDFGAGMGDFLILGLKPAGTVQWAKTFGSSEDDYMARAVATSDGDLVAVGSAGTPGPGANLYVVRVHPDGSTAWQEKFIVDNREGAGDVIATPDGGCVVAGIAQGFASMSQPWILKLDGTGTPVWQYRYDGGDLWSLRALKGGGYAGCVTLGNNQLWVFKIDDDGLPVWGKIYDQTGFNYGHSVVATSDGGCLVVGQGSIPSAGPSVQYAFMVLKINADGSFAWENKYTGGFQDEAHGAIELDNGDFMVCGVSASVSHNDGVLLRLHPDGSIADSVRSAGVRYDSFNSIRKASNGGFWITGETSTYGNGVISLAPDLWFLQTDKDGTLPGPTTAGGMTLMPITVTVIDQMPTATATSVTPTVVAGDGVDAPVIVSPAP